MISRFFGRNPAFGAKKRFHPPDFNVFHPNPLVQNALHHFWPVSYGKSGSKPFALCSRMIGNTYRSTITCASDTPVHKVQISRGAINDLQRLPRLTTKRIEVASGQLMDNPRPKGSLELANRRDTWRIRVGDYRVIYEIIDKQVCVLVIRVRHRRDVYR